MQPISEPDLASYMADCIREPKLWDQVLPIGGPGEALSALQQGEMLFNILGQEPRFIKVPVALFDAIIGALDWLASVFAGMKDTAEFGRIGKYYAVESMLVLNPQTGKYDAAATPSYGKDTLRCEQASAWMPNGVLTARPCARSHAQKFFRARRQGGNGGPGAGRRSSAWTEVSERKGVTESDRVSTVSSLKSIEYSLCKSAASEW